VSQFDPDLRSDGRERSPRRWGVDRREVRAGEVSRAGPAAPSRMIGASPTNAGHACADPDRRMALAARSAAASRTCVARSSPAAGPARDTSPARPRPTGIVGRRGRIAPLDHVWIPCRVFRAPAVVGGRVEGRPAGPAAGEERQTNVRSGDAERPTRGHAPIARASVLSPVTVDAPSTARRRRRARRTSPPPVRISRRSTAHRAHFVPTLASRAEPT